MVKIIWSSIILLCLTLILSNTSEGVTLGMSLSDLDFQKMPPDTSATRSILLSTDSKDILTVDILIDGPLEGWMTIPETAIVSKGNPTRLELTLTIPENAARGAYTGRLRITPRQPESTQSALQILPGLIGTISLEVIDSSSQLCRVTKVRFTQERGVLIINPTISNLAVNDLTVEMETRFESEGVTERERHRLGTIGGSETKELRVSFRALETLKDQPLTIMIPVCGYERTHSVSYQLERAFGKDGIFISMNLSPEVNKGNPLQVIGIFQNTASDSYEVTFIGRATSEDGDLVELQSEKLIVGPGETVPFTTFVTLADEGTWLIEGKFHYGNWESMERGKTVKVIEGSTDQNGEGFQPWLIVLAIGSLMLIVVIAIVRIIKRNLSNKK